VATGDFDTLMAEVRQVVDVPVSLAGSFKVDASLAEGRAFEATVATKRLVVGTDGDRIGPVDLDLGAAGTIRSVNNPKSN
jgi:hypothetical protein